MSDYSELAKEIMTSGCYYCKAKIMKGENHKSDCPVINEGNLSNKEKVQLGKLLILCAQMSEALNSPSRNTSQFRGKFDYIAQQLSVQDWKALKEKVIQ